MGKIRKNKQCKKVIESIKKQGLTVISPEEFKEAGIIRKKKRKKRK